MKTPMLFLLGFVVIVLIGAIMYDPKKDYIGAFTYTRHRHPEHTTGLTQRRNCVWVYGQGEQLLVELLRRFRLVTREVQAALACLRGRFAELPYCRQLKCLYRASLGSVAAAL